MMDSYYLHIALMTVVTLHIMKDATATPNSCNSNRNGDMMDCYGRNLNRIPTIPSSVRTVNLENNRLDSVMGDSFEGATSLKILSLDNNLIQHLQVTWGKDLLNLHRLSMNYNLLTAMHNATFVGLGSLKSILLSHNKITSLFPGWCDGADNISLVDLSENKISSIGRTSWCIFTRLEFLNLSNNEITRLQSNWAEGMVHLKYLYLQNNNLKALENGSFSFLISLYDLQLRNNSIMTVEVGWGRDLGKLTTLQLSKNKLKKLPPSLFYGMVNLTRIDMQAANVKKIHRGSLKFLEGLEEITLQNNSIKIIHEGVFSVLRSVERLTLQYNKIYHIEPRSFCGMVSLVELYLKNNRIMTLFRYTFAGLRMLTHLYLQNNNIVSLAEYWNADLNNVLYIDMIRNNISNIENEQSNYSLWGGPADFDTPQTCGNESLRGASHPKTVSSLKILFMSRNPIGPLLHRVIFKGLVKLRYLILAYCNLESIEGSYFTDLISLKYLDISHNNILRLDSEAFRSVPSIVAIDAKFNAIESVGPNTFDGTHLSFVNLHENALQTFSRDMLPKRFREFELRLSQNPLICDCRINWLHKLITKERIRSVGLSFLSTVDFIFPMSLVDIRNVRCENMNGLQLSSIPLKYIPCDPSVHLNMTTPMAPPAIEIPKTTSPRHFRSTEISTKGNLSTNAPTMSTLGDFNRETGVSSTGGQNNAMQDKGTSQFFFTTNNTVFIIIGLLLVVVILFTGKQLSQCGNNCRNISIRARSVIYQDVNSSLVMRPLTSRDFRPVPPPPPPPRREDLGKAITQTPSLEHRTVQRLRNNPVVRSKRVVKHTYFCEGLGSVQHRDGSLTALTQNLGDGNNFGEILAKPRVRHMYFRDHVVTAPGCPRKTKVQRNEFHHVVTEALIHEEASDSIFVTRETKASNPNLTETIDGADQEEVLTRRHYFLDSNWSTGGTSNSTSLRGDDFERDCESHENGDDDDDTSSVIIYDINQDEFSTRTTDPGMIMKELAVSSYSSEDDFDCGISIPEIDNDDGIDYDLGVFELESGKLSSTGCSFGLADDDSLASESVNTTDVIFQETLV